MRPKTILLSLLPLLLFAGICFFAWRGLSLNPRELPSPLIDHPAPRFVVPEVLNSKEHLTEKAFKNKIILLNFWATWCVTCRVEHPMLMKLKDLGISIYSINYKDKLSKARDWLKQYGNPYVISGFDPKGNVALNYGVYGTPETFVIKNGIIRYKRTGVIDERVWNTILLPLLQNLQREED